MRVLLDTCVVSEILRTNGLQRVKQHVSRYPHSSTFLSAITIGEMIRGAALLEPGRRRDSLAGQIMDLESAYADRILPIDVDVARIWAELSVERQRAGRRVPVLDGMIAASAIRHGLHVVTRNVADFEGTGARIINPWEPS